MLSTRSQLELTDICWRLISTDGEVSLQERIWMSKICQHNEQAERLRDEMLKE